MSPLVWYLAALVVAAFAAGILVGRGWGFDDGYDVGRADRLDHELDVADRCRMLTIVDPPGRPVDCVERGWVDR